MHPIQLPSWKCFWCDRVFRGPGPPLRIFSWTSWITFKTFPSLAPPWRPKTRSTTSFGKAPPTTTTWQTIHCVFKIKREQIFFTTLNCSPRVRAVTSWLFKQRVNRRIWVDVFLPENVVDVIKCPCLMCINVKDYEFLKSFPLFQCGSHAQRIVYNQLQLNFISCI